MALRAFLVVGGLVTLMDSDGFQSKTELLSDPNADSASCISAGCDVDTQNDKNSLVVIRLLSSITTCTVQ